MSENLCDGEQGKKQAVEQLKISEARYRSLTEQSHDLICRWLPDTTLTYVNQAYCDFFDKKSEDLLGRSWINLLPEDSQDEVRKIVSSLLSKPEITDYEHKVVGADGKERWMTWWDNPVYDENGGLIEFHSSGRDITERIKNEKLLKESHERLGLAQKAAGMGDFIWDVKSGEVFCSDGLYDMLLYDKAEKIDYTKVNKQIHHPEDLESVTQWLNSCINDPTCLELKPNEYRLIRKDKKIIHVRTIGRIERIGEDIRVFATILDITEQKEKEAQIKEKNKILSELNELIKEQLNVLSYRELLDTINNQLKNNIGPDFIAYSEYSNTKKTNTLLKIDATEQAIDIIRKSGFDKVIGFEFSINDEMLNDMMTNTFTVKDSLFDISFGQVPEFISEEFIKETGIEKFIGITYKTGGELFGNSLLGFKKDSPIPSEYFFDSFSNATAQSLCRWKAEEETRDFLERLEGLLANTPNLISIFDQDGRYLNVSDSIAELLELSKEDIIGKTFSDLLSPEIAADFMATVEKIKETGEKIVKYDTIPINGKNRIFESINFSCINKDNPEKLTYVSMAIDVTEAKEAEERLQESKILLESVYQSIQDGISVLNTDLTIRDVNHTMIRRFADKMPIVGKKCYEVYHGRSEPCKVCPTLKTIKGKTKWSEIVPLTKKNKQIGWVEVYTYPIIDKKTGEVDGVVEFVRDITEHKRAEEAIRESEELLALTQKIAHVGSWSLDLISNRLFWSDEVYKIFGISSKGFSATYEAFLDIIHPDDRMAVDNAYRNSIRDGLDEYDIEHRIVRHDTGEIRFVHERCVHERDAEGVIIRSIGMVQDITERKQAEELLRESEQFMRETQAIAKLGGWKANPRTDRLIWNDGVYDIIEECRDYKPGRAEGVKYYHPQYMAAINSGLEKCLDKGEPFMIEAEITTAKGNHRWVEVRAFARIDSGGEKMAMGTIQDITERKLAEEKLKINYHFQEIISDISTNFVKTTAESFDEDINYMLNQLGKFFRVDRSFLYLFSHNHAFVTNTHEWCNEGVTPQIHAVQNFPTDSFNWIVERILSLKYVHIPDIKDLPPEAVAEKELFASQEIKSLINIPVKSVDGIWGFIGFDAVKDYYSWSDNEINSLVVVANIVGDMMQKLDNEKKIAKVYCELDEEIAKAEKIHQRVFPSKMPQTDKISIAGYNQPATQMGGDTYNVIRSGDKMVIYVADVMGHGLDGAMLSVFIKDTIDNYIVFKPEELNPQKLLRHLDNQYRREAFPKMQMIAIFLAVLDLKTNELKYASAGFQTRPLIRMGDGSKETLETNGMFISNSVPQTMLEFKESTLTLTPGTTIMISSDGLPEHDNGKEFYDKRYHEIFYENSHLPPEIIVQATNKDFCYFNDNSLVGLDDITYLVLQYGNTPFKRHNITIKSDFGELENLYEKIVKITAGFPEQNNMQTCLHEIVVNAIEHGNKLDPAKIVTIDIAVSPGYVLFEVEDEGEGFDWCEKLDKSINMSLSVERGRGIAMTGLMSGNLFYNSKGNRATLLIQSKTGRDS